MATVPASGPSARSQHATLTAGQVDVVTLDRGYPYVEVVVRSSPTTSGASYTIDRGDNDQQQVTPTYLGPGTYYVAPGGARREKDDVYGNAARLGMAPQSVVRIVSDAAASYSITGFDGP